MEFSNDESDRADAGMGGTVEASLIVSVGGVTLGDRSIDVGDEDDVTDAVWYRSGQGEGGQLHGDGLCSRLSLGVQSSSGEWPLVPGLVVAVRQQVVIGTGVDEIFRSENCRCGGELGSEICKTSSWPAHESVISSP
jgi:hypothetical protein